MRSWWRDQRGLPEPLEPLGRADLAVLRSGVALRVVIIVRPLVDRGGPRFLVALPAVGGLRHGDTERGEDSLDLGLGDRIALVDDEQVHGALDVGQVRSIPGIDTDKTIIPRSVDRLADRPNPRILTNQPMDEIAFRSAQGGGEGTVSRSDMDDEAAFHPCLIEDRAALGSRVLR
jgi:hypothetical protein